MLSYSVAIRTLGTAGKKYQKLLDSIQNSKRRPESVIVVLPEGFAPPPEQLGYERFVYCEKGILRQRYEALKYITSDCTFFLDDDIEFDPDFVDKLMEPIEAGLFDCSIGPLFAFFPASRMGAIASTIMGSVSLSFFRRDMYVKILRSGGWSYHTFDTTEKRYYPTESFAGTCFMARTDAMRSLCLEDENIWLERFGYALEDRVTSYKLVKLGYRACAVSNALYVHNDAKTSTASFGTVNTRPAFCMGYMHRVFWQRFIQDPEKNRLRRFQNWFCLGYWEVMSSIYRLIKLCSPSERPAAIASRQGLKEGKRYVKSEEYRALPPIDRGVSRSRK